MSSGWTQVATSALSVLGAGGGLGATVAAVLRWRTTKADAADVITDTALILIEPLKARISELEHEIARLRSEARQIADELLRLRTAILDPTATLEDLRGLVNPPKGRTRL